MNATEPTWTQVLQRSVHWWLIGGMVCLAGLFGMSRLFELLAQGDIHSWAMPVAAVLHYSLLPLILVAAHLFLAISIVGLAVLPRQQIPDKKRTIGLCFMGMGISLIVLPPLYGVLDISQIISWHR